MEIQGTLKQLQPVIERGEFKSRKVWINTDTETKYPQVIELEVSGKNIDIFDGVSNGAPVICSINLRGREWVNPDTVKNPTGAAVVFNTLSCWKVAAGGVHGKLPGDDVVLPEDDPNSPLPF